MLAGHQSPIFRTTFIIGRTLVEPSIDAYDVPQEPKCR